MVSTSWVKNRRGLLQHLTEQRMALSDFAVFQLLLLQADKANGVVWTKASILADHFTDGKERTMQDALARLKAKGYVKSFQQAGSRASYPILINKYEISVGGLKGGLIDAEQTVDWRSPVISERTDDVGDDGSDDGTEAVLRTGHRNQVLQVLDSSNPQETATQSGNASATASPMDSPEVETSTPADRPPVDGKTYEKLEDVPREDQARILTSRLFIDLGSPKDKRKQLSEWSRELDPLCDQFEFPLLCQAIRWAITEDQHWPQFIRRARNLVDKNNAEKIVDAYRAHLRGKATWERSQRQSQEQDTKKNSKQAPSKYGNGQVALEGSESL